MKTTKEQLKKSLLVGTLVLSLGGITGCNTNNKSKTSEDNKKIVELQPNELSIEETKALKVGDVIPEGKKVNRELLEQQGMDYVYFYDVYIKRENGTKVLNSDSTMYLYNEAQNEEKIDMQIEEVKDGVTTISNIYNVYNLRNIEIVKAEIVYDKNTDTYKKQVTLGNGNTDFVPIANENNIDKDKVKTLK